MHHYVIYLALHGVLVLIVSLVSGRWFAKAIIVRGNDVAWRVFHSGGSMSGIMLIAFSSLLPIVVLPQWASTLFVWLIILGTWLFIIGMLAAAITGERGLKAGGSFCNRGIYFSYLFAALFSIVSCGLLLIGLCRAL